MVCVYVCVCVCVYVCVCGCVVGVNKVGGSLMSVVRTQQGKVQGICMSSTAFMYRQRHNTCILFDLRGLICFKRK